MRIVEVGLADACYMHCFRQVTCQRCRNAAWELEMQGTTPFAAPCCLSVLWAPEREAWKYSMLQKSVASTSACQGECWFSIVHI